MLFPQTRLSDVARQVAQRSVPGRYHDHFHDCYDEDHDDGHYHDDQDRYDEDHDDDHHYHDSLIIFEEKTHSVANMK